jgi:hypothetical protein
MEEEYSLLDLRKIYVTNYYDERINSSITLAHFCVDFKLRPCEIKKMKIRYCERTFFRHLDSLRKGDGDREAVF